MRNNAKRMLNGHRLSGSEREQKRYKGMVNIDQDNYSWTLIGTWNKRFFFLIKYSYNIGASETKTLLRTTTNGINARLLSISAL